MRRILPIAAVFATAFPLLILADDARPSASAAIQLQLGDLLASDGRLEEALDAYTKAAGAKDDPVVLRSARLGVTLTALRIAEFERALAEVSSLRAQEPKDPQVASLYGEALWAAGLFQEAESAYQATLALDPRNARAHNGVARALAARNDLDGALTSAREALRLAPREPDFYHTLGFIHERRREYDEAVIALGNYVSLLPNRDRSEKAAWSRAEIRFLRSFGRRVPLEVVSDPNETYSIDFRVVRDKVIVPVRVNGGRPLDLVLDTGAEQTVLSRRTAERAGVFPVVYTLSAGVGDAGLRGLQVGRIDTLEIGTLKVRNVPCLIKNPALRGLPTRESDSFSPVSLGLSTTIDYKARKLIIARKLPAETNAIELPMRLHRLAMVRGTLNGQKPVHFVVDTGGEVISISSTTAETLPKRAVRRIPLRVYGNSGWDRTAFLLPGVDLAFDKLQLPNLPVVVLNLRAPSALLGFQLGGIVGHRFLSKYRVSVDLDKSVLRLAN